MTRCVFKKSWLPPPLVGFIRFAGMSTTSDRHQDSNSNNGGNVAEPTLENITKMAIDRMLPGWCAMPPRHPEEGQDDARMMGPRPHSWHIPIIS